MSAREDAARRAVKAVSLAVKVVDVYGRGSHEAGVVLSVATEMTEDAIAAGCTRADFDAAHEES
ncbi:hypothetical protein [Streptomyces sp. SGAir0957]